MGGEKLPVTKVVMYKHGVAYVERKGEVEGDATIDLLFKATEMNDVLKSITVLDLSGKGIISSISYAANQSMSQQLEDVSSVHIPKDKSLTGLLNELRGTMVHVEPIEGASFDGLLIGTEVFSSSGQRLNANVPESMSLGGAVKHHVNLLVNGNQLTTMNVMELKSISLLDDNLKTDLQYILNVMINSKKKDSKKLTIYTKGEGRRMVSVSYVVVAPVWKTSYRMLLPSTDKREKAAALAAALASAAAASETSDATTTTTTTAAAAAATATESTESTPNLETFSSVDQIKSDSLISNNNNNNNSSSSKTAAKPIIQGWALVDNMFDEDWNNVALSLVSGLPISFEHDLYSARFKERPVVDVQEKGVSYRITPQEEAMESHNHHSRSLKAQMVQKRMSNNAYSADPFSNNWDTPAMPPQPSDDSGGAMEHSVDVQTSTSSSDSSDLFSYDIDNPVTVCRNEAALVPILSGECWAKQVAVYNREGRERNAMSAVLFRNNTGFVLEGGPVTFREADRYVGEAFMDGMKMGETKILPYAVELGVVVWQSAETKSSPVSRTKVFKGTFYAYSDDVSRTIYKIKNKTERTISLVVEHRYAKGCELFDTPQPYERTDSFMRFGIILKPNFTTTFVVKERRNSFTSFGIRSASVEQIKTLFTNNYAPSDEASRSALLKVIELNEKSSTIRTQTNRLNNDKEETFKNQSRIRNNLGSLSSSNPREAALRDRYIDELTSQEDVLSQLKDTQRSLQVDADATIKELDEVVAALEFSHTVPTASSSSTLPPPTDITQLEELIRVAQQKGKANYTGGNSLIICNSNSNNNRNSNSFDDNDDDDDDDDDDADDADESDCSDDSCTQQQQEQEDDEEEEEESNYNYRNSRNNSRRERESRRRNNNNSYRNQVVVLDDAEEWEDKDAEEITGLNVVE